MTEKLLTGALNLTRNEDYEQVDILFQENPVKGKMADVVLAAYNAAEVALRLVRPGTEVSQYEAFKFWCKF